MGSADADIMVALTGTTAPPRNSCAPCATALPQEFPGTDFYFLPDDIVSQILNFGLPAPIDVQIIGQNVEANRDLADRIMDQMRRIPGMADLRIQQTFDQPKLHVFTDRIKAAAERLHADRRGRRACSSRSAAASRPSPPSGSVRKTASATTWSRRRRSTTCNRLQDLRNSR